MAELADAPDLGSGVPDVKVQVLSPVPSKGYKKDIFLNTDSNSRIKVKDLYHKHCIKAFYDVVCVIKI